MYQGSAYFEGNQVEKLLNCVDSLEAKVLRECSPEIIIKALPYVELLRLFKKVVGACFGQTRDKNYTTYISQFMKAYRALGISIPLKVRI